MPDQTPLERAAIHPRPQRTRARWTDLNGPWGFAYDDADAGSGAGWHQDTAPFTRTIEVPFPPESPASGIGDATFHPIVWYRRTFEYTAPRGGHAQRGFRREKGADSAAGERLLLHFGAVDYRARIWVNGQLVAEHEGGQTPFSADITDALRKDKAEQIIVVR